MDRRANVLMNIIRHVCPEGLPLIADFTIDDKGEITAMSAYLILASPSGVATVVKRLPDLPYHDEIVSDLHAQINACPERYNIPKLNDQ
jgi:hypothetical protein